MDGKYDVIIVGAGLSGLCVAHFLQKRQPDMDVVILEKSDRTGGAIRTFRENGFQAEWGPHGFLDNIAASRQLLTESGLDQEAQKAPLGDFVRYICMNGKLVLVPQSPPKIIASSLLPFFQKLRVLADLWKKPRLEEQTVSQWITYRFGSGLLPIADAVFTGTYAGDIDRLSIDGVMPGVRSLEKEAGSVLRGLIRKMRQAKQSQKGSVKRQLPSMISFAQGMSRLPERLAEERSIFYETPVDALVRKDDGWEAAAGSKRFTAAALVLALPVNQTLSLIRNIPALAGKQPPITRIPEAKIATVVMGFTSAAQIPFGFGYLAPEREKRFALGALFSTHMFPGRAPEGHVMLEALVGGRRHPEKLELADEALVNNCFADIRQLMKLAEPPCFSKVLRVKQGIPQLEMGYPELLTWRTSVEEAMSGLHICGFGWGGVGINDMVKAGQQVAETIAHGAEADRRAALKNIYF
jgi:oxygen-dependent protoporphyrinogen oxidase